MGGGEWQWVGRMVSAANTGMLRVDRHPRVICDRLPMPVPVVPVPMHVVPVPVPVPGPGLNLKGQSLSTISSSRQGQPKEFTGGDYTRSGRYVQVTFLRVRRRALATALLPFR